MLWAHGQVVVQPLRAAIYVARCRQWCWLVPGREMGQRQTKKYMRECQDDSAFTLVTLPTQLCAFLRRGTAGAGAGSKCGRARAAGRRFFHAGALRKRHAAQLDTHAAAGRAAQRGLAAVQPAAQGGHATYSAFLPLSERPSSAAH